MAARLKSLYRHFGFAPGQMRSDSAGSLPKTLTTDEALVLLAIELRDAGALIAIYDNQCRRLRRTAARLFGRDPQVAAKVVNSILVAIGRQAPTYDPQSMDAVEWIGRCAEAEAKKLLAMLHSGGKIARRTRRAM